MPISATDTVDLALQHTKQQLFKPFRFWQWTKLAFVGLLAGEMGSGGGGLRSFARMAGQRGGSSGQGSPFPHIDPALIASLVAVLLTVGLVVFLVMLYISSTMRFVLFDSVLTKECRIRDQWSRRQTPGLRYFLWQLGLMLATFAIAVIFVGIPAGFAFAMGWFRAPREHLLPLILGGLVLFFVFVTFVVTLAVVHVFTKDFVIPQMALQDINAIEGWRRLWPMLRAEKWDYFVYVVLKIVLAIIAGILVTIASVIITIIIAIPVAGVVAAVILAGKTAGITWNVVTITFAALIGCGVLGIYMYVIALIAVPVMVFFPAYSIYFFAGRYQPLNAALYAPPQSEPPRLMASPQPIG